MQHNSLIHAEPDQDDDHTQDFTALLEGLNRASGFKLDRLRSATRSASDREHRQRSGQVVRLNDRTITVICASQKWRVSYTLLHRVVEARSGG